MSAPFYPIHSNEHSRIDPGRSSGPQNFLRQLPYYLQLQIITGFSGTPKIILKFCVLKRLVRERLGVKGCNKG